MFLLNTEMRKKYKVASDVDDDIFNVLYSRHKFSAAFAVLGRLRYNERVMQVTQQ